jgi:trimethylamine--corrinoid protein Co-methyltransferase
LNVASGGDEGNPQGKGPTGGQYKPLRQDQVRTIHEASLALLNRTGIESRSKQVQETFRDAGAEVDGVRIRIPPGMIEEAIDTAPKRLLLAGRQRRHDLLLEGDRVYVGTGGAALKVLDFESEAIRSARLSDVGRAARLVDALEHIDFYLIPVYPMDVPADRVEVHKYYAAFAHTTKHVQGGVYTIDGIRDVVAMAERISGGERELRERPIVSFITSWMISPLLFSDGVTELLLEICRLRLPVVLSAAPAAGATAPVTLAGMLAQLNAEQLAGLTLTQLTSPGCPVLLGPIPTITDMRTGKYLAGAVELGMCNAAMTQMIHHYNLPIYNSAGMTEAKIPDYQAGVEKAQSLFQVTLAGSNFVHHAAGMLEDMSAISYEQFVLDDELLGMAMRAVRGIEVNDETLALDVIDRVGPGGHFLLDDHTSLHMRHEHYYPSGVIDREIRAAWEANGASDARDRARGVARRLLAEHRAQPLDPKADAWIRQRFSINPDWLDE